MSTYTVRFGETISDVVINSTGNINNWSLILTENGFSEWVPMLTAGQIIQIPDSVLIDQNTLRDKISYPANNASVNDIYDKINSIFTQLKGFWILTTGFWNDNALWVDSGTWND